MKALAPLLAGLLLAALLPISLYAQYPGNPHGLTIRQNFLNYNFPYAHDVTDTEHYGLGIEFSYLRALGRQVNLAVPVRAGMVKLPLSETRFEDSRLTASMDLVFQLKLARPDHLLMPYVFAGAGAQVEQWEEPRYVFYAPGGVGLNLRLAPHFYLNLEGAYRFAPREDYRDHLQLGAGFWFVLGKYDHNRDFRRSKKKKEVVLPPPPSMAAPIDETEPEPEQKPETVVVPIFPDRDGDGSPDHLDICPDEPGLSKHQGCPDSDGDDVPDHLDMCPGVPGAAETQGCPDSDYDGIPDHLDACPENKGPASTRGCPDIDRDGVPDYEDKCPSVSGPADNFGCPKPSDLELEALQSAMYSIRFEDKSTQLPSQSYPVLDNVADILKRYPHYHLKIRSHTHNLGSDSDNLRLTEKRASYIYDYFVGSGIAAERLAYEGIGEREPIANNKYAPGRAQNERTEFLLFIP